RLHDVPPVDIRPNSRLGRIADVAPVTGGSATDRLAARTERPGLVVILHIHLPAQVDLFYVRQAAHLAGLLARLSKDGEQNRRQDSDDRDHNEQLDQGEALPLRRHTTHGVPPFNWPRGAGSRSHSHRPCLPFVWRSAPHGLCTPLVIFLSTFQSAL